MTVDRFYPYRTAAGQVAFEMDLADGLVLRRTGDGSIVAYEEEPEAVTIMASVCVTDDVFDTVLPPAERDDPPVDIRLVYASRESRRRSSLSLPGDGIHEGVLTLEREDWRGVVEIRAILVRTRTGPGSTPGFATDHGSLLAWSEPRRVLFDEPQQPPGDQLEVRWENFAESTNPWRRRNAASIFALDTGGERPTVFLNSGIPRAVDILGSAGSHGRKARIRDATNYMIVHQVWSSLLATALARIAAITRTDQGMSMEDLLGEVNDWEARILRDWSGYLYPDLDSGTAALEELLRAAGDPAETQTIMELLPNAIQQRFRTFRGFQGLVQEGDTL
jgi:hypothetical protein